MKKAYKHLRKATQQVGINIVDLMMWLVIAALLLAAAIQSIGYYQKNAYLYQMKEAVNVAASRIMAMSANDGSVDYEDAVAVINETNAATPNDDITLTVDNIALSAAGEDSSTESGFELVSAVTAAPSSLETFYIRATHTAVTDKDAVHYFKDTANKKVGTHVDNKGNNNGGGSGSGSTNDGSNTGGGTPVTPVEPAPTPTPTPTPTPEPTPEPAPTPVNQFVSLKLTQQFNSPALNFYGMTTSADGSIVYAGSNVGSIYRSADSGVTWTALTSAGSFGWYGISTNAAGTKIVASTNTGFVYVSNDSGATWTQTSLPSQPWNGTAMTPDGSKIIASYSSSGDGNIYVSTDGGTTWNVQKDAAGAAINSRWRAVDLSDDGKVMAAASLSTSQIWLSTDSGTTWTRKGPIWAAGYVGTAVSANGQTITSGQVNGGIETTTNGGTSWNTKPGGVNSDYYRISMSADGTKLIATGNLNTSGTPNAVYTSIDSGATWKNYSEVGTAQWFSSAISADGKKLYFASTSGRKIWSGVWGPEPAPAPSGTATTASFSWATLGSASTTDTNDLAMSADGTKLIAAKNASSMFKSTDSGATWVNMGNRVGDARSVSMSADGTKVLTGTDGYYSYLSKDGGSTWVQAIPNTLAQAWYTAMSADGTKMYIMNVEGTRFWYSTNSGTTWTQSANAPQHNIVDLAVSDDGSTLIAGGFNQQIMKSTDNGVSWSYMSGPPISGQWYGIDVNTDGSKMIAGDLTGSGGVWTSSDSGSTWKKLTMPVTGGWRNVSTSSDGMKLTAMRNSNGNIYTSKDAGITWTTESSLGTGSWRAVASSSDGTKVVFGGGAGKIVKGQYQ